MDTEDEKRDVVDRYRLSRIHSEGGLGRVWLANDPDIGRDVALKELLAAQAKDPEARARFIGEAKITGQLEHPNIVPVYDVGKLGDDHRPFYTMRFVRGPTLSDAIKEDHGTPRGKRVWPRRRQRLLRALCSVCNAISHAHSRGIVHRDLKPDNIILGPHGELILLDWGLAKRIQDETPEVVAEPPQPRLLETQFGSVMGTIAYMSPEQAAGQKPDERTDIYGIGAILFEILTGQPPHTGDNPVDVLREIVDGDSPAPRSIDPMVPPPLDAICRKAMSKHPGERYAKASDIVVDIERWLIDEEVAVLPDGLFGRIARWVRRNQSWAYAGTGAILLISIIASIAAVRLGAAADRERELREHSIQVSARFAARALSSDILLRWSILESAATSDLLRRELSDNDDDDDSQLQEWLLAQFELHRQKTRAVSWIVQDRTGLQRGRAPVGDSIGKNYAFRDYFHGQGKDLPQNNTDPVAPIEKQYRSVVFVSQVTDNLMVAFSVPVFDTDRADRKVVGVLGMTVELGKFDILGDVELDDNQVAVLIDTREDWTGEQGLVLQHAALARQRSSQGRRPGSDSEPRTIFHVPEERVKRFTETARGIDPDYEDPVGGDYDGRWLAAFEPVLVSGSGSNDNDTGWVVIIQERDDRSPH